VTAVVLPAFAAPASAQSWKWDLGFQAGYSFFTNSIKSDSLGGTSQVKFENKPRFGGTLGYWFTDKVGVRANYKYMNGEVTEQNTDTELFGPVNLHSASGDLLFRFGAPNETWMGSEFLPYLALGVGAKWFNGRGDAFTCRDNVTDEAPAQWNCSPFEVAGNPNLVALAEDKVIMGLVGLGADWRISPRMAITLEANDRMFRPPFARAVSAGGGNFDMPNGDHRISKLTHELGLDVGLKFLFGLATPAVVAVTPTPTVQQPPPPPPPVVTPPAPVENAIQVCVVDPTQPNGLRMQNAIYLPASGDTMVVMNGNRVRLSQSVGNVMVARNADWYVRGEPLQITVGKEKMSYGTESGAVQIDAGKLSYLGTVNGYPVYANKDEVADVNQALLELRQANASRDLGNILDERKDLRGELDDVKYLYVPLQSTGCVFQTFRMIEQVKKGK
jgi:opacity protein-like surface antigen